MNEQIAGLIAEERNALRQQLRSLDQVLGNSNRRGNRKPMSAEAREKISNAQKVRHQKARKAKATRKPKAAKKQDSPHADTALDTTQGAPLAL